MIAKFVALGDCTPRDHRVALQVAADDEERCTRPGVCERIEHLRGRFRVRSVIERQRHARSIARTMRDRGVERAGGRTKHAFSDRECEAPAGRQTASGVGPKAAADPSSAAPPLNSSLSARQRLTMLRRSGIEGLSQG